MVPGWARSASNRRKIRKKKRSSHKYGHAKLPFAKRKMEKAQWWLFFDGKGVAVDGVTLGIVLAREEFSPGCIRGKEWLN
jgi:hypothetical protein